MVSLSKFATVRSGFAFKSEEWTASGVPVVRITNLRGGRLDMRSCTFVSDQSANAAREFALKRGDLLITMTGNVGEVAVVEDDERRVLNQRVGRISVDTTVMKTRLLFHLLRLPEIRSALEGRAHGTAQPNISPTEFGMVEIPLPTIDKQDELISLLDAIDKRIHVGMEMCQTLGTIASTTLRGWLTGPTHGFSHSSR
jgi:type I restriction enzyme, S subunit